MNPLCFRRRRKPATWLVSAERLRAAAEIILGDQVKQEVPYFRAVDDARHEALMAAIAAPDGSAHVQVACVSPNYLPGQILYAFAMENALKGLMVARNPALVSPRRIDNSLKSHDLIRLAEKAQFSLALQEVPVLRKLSYITEWAGRYPVATRIEKHINDENPIGINRDSLLDWGSQHPHMRLCFDRMIQELEKALPQPPNRFDVIVAVKPIGT
jgi:hypothetical protein